MLDLACAVEMVHACSLVLDDLPAMDDAALRRGRPTVHRAFGEAIALLAAFALFNRAYALVAEAGATPPPCAATRPPTWPTTWRRRSAATA